MDVSDNQLQWVFIAYSITFGGLLLLGGRAADLLGRQRMLMIGLTVFSVASLACGLANAIGVLIGARAVQGVGAAIVSPAVLSIITTAFAEGPERNKALGIWGCHRRERCSGRRALRRRGRTIGLLIASAVRFVAFLVIETRSSSPMVPFDIFRIRSVTGANVCEFFVGAVVSRTSSC